MVQGPRRPTRTTASWPPVRHGDRIAGEPIPTGSEAQATMKRSRQPDRLPPRLAFLKKEKTSMRFIPQRAGRYGRSVPVSVALAIALCAVLLAGCGKKDKIVGPEPPGSPTYPKLSSPVNVLRALEQAYEARDSVEFKLLYNDSLYVGTTFDQRNPGNPVQLTFY